MFLSRFKKSNQLAGGNTSPAVAGDNNALESKQKIGQQAESLACDFLCQNGLSLRLKNYRCRLGEIDLVMFDAKQNSLVFVEVKKRKNNNFGTPLETVTASKQAKVIKAAQHYINENDSTNEHAIRFDVVGILDNKDQPEINWIPNAFYAF